MARAKTPSFVCEVPLRVSPSEARTLLARFEAARQLYNACLGEALRRLTLLRNSWLGTHIDSHTAQKLAVRAFEAVEKVQFGKAKKVRFKGKNQLSSVEGKSNAAGIRFRADRIEWSGLALYFTRDERDPVIAHGLSSRVKYVRLVRRELKGTTRFYAQLVCEGTPCQKPSKPAPKQGVVGIDLGPSTIAAVGKYKAILVQFCAQLDLQEKEIRRLQRKLERQRRANKQNYNGDGTIKTGKLTWVYSKGYIRTRAKLAEIRRKQAAHRKSLHGRLANELLQLGNVFQMENVSLAAWQKMFGKSINNRAPGIFVSRLTLKAESAGGKVLAFPTRTTKLSQTCHCGRVQKKELSERWHSCECGVRVQRDLYSAYLAQFVEGVSLQAKQARACYKGAEALLETAFKEAVQRAKEGKIPQSFGAPRQRKSSSSSTGRAGYYLGKEETKSQDVYQKESLAKVSFFSLITPGL